MLEDTSKLMNLCTKLEWVQPSVLRGEFVPGNTTCEIKGKNAMMGTFQGLFSPGYVNPKEDNVHLFHSWTVPTTEILFN